MALKASRIAKIGRRFAPKPADGLCRLVRQGTRVQSGAGFKNVAATVGDPIPFRVIYIGNMNVREKVIAYQVSTEADYIATFPPGTVLRTSDSFQVIGETWTPGAAKVAGQRVIPTVENGKAYVAAGQGITGDEEPTFLTENDSTVEDNDLVWTCSGEYQIMQIIQLFSPSTYGDLIASKAAVTIKQRVGDKV